MDNREKRQEQIDKKILGRLSASEQKVLEEQLREDVDWQNALSDTELALEAIDAAEDDALKARLQAIEGKLAKKSSGSSHLKVVRGNQDANVVSMQPFYRRHLRAIAAAALFLLAAGLYFVLPAKGTTTTQLYADNFEAYRNIAVDLTRGDDGRSDEQAAFVAYENQEYTVALERMRQLPDSPVKEFYIGQSLLGLDKYAQAVSRFQPLVESKEFPLREQSEWYLALAYLGNKQAKDAKAVLEKIVTNEGHPFLKEAERVLRKL